ncbi:hypothetical protein Tco_1424384, partial [Tanacetum coccineum]
EDLAKMVSHVEPSFKDLGSSEDDPVIVVDDSDEDEDDEVHATENVETEDTSVPKSSSLRSFQVQELTNQVLILQSQKYKLELEKNKAEAEAALLKAQPSYPNVEQLLFDELTEEVKGLKKQVHELEIELPGDLEEIPTKLEDFTKTVAIQVTSVQAKLKTLDALPCLLLNVTKALNKFAQVLDSASSKAGDQRRQKALSSKEVEKESTISDSDDETHVTSSMKLEEDAKAEAAKQEGEVRKAELVDLLGPEVVKKYYNDKLQYDRYYDKMLNRIAISRITNCDDPLEKLNDLANKKRKHADDIHDYFKANKRLKSSVQYKDHLPSTELNEPVLGMIMFNCYHRQDFVTIEDLKDFSNTMLYTVQEIFFRRHQGPELDVMPGPSVLFCLLKLIRET